MQYIRLVFAFFAATFLAGSTATGNDTYTTQLATETDRLTRITEHLHKMADSTAMQCREPIELPLRIHDGFVNAAYCHVYVSKDAEPVIGTGGAEYPAGSLLVKTKFPKEHPNRIELYTMMRKMNPGYDPDNGDWEYSVIDGRTRRI